MGKHCGVAPSDNESTGLNTPPKNGILWELAIFMVDTKESKILKMELKIGSLRVYCGQWEVGVANVFDITMSQKCLFGCLEVHRGKY